MRALHLCADFWPNFGGIEQFVMDLAFHSRQAGIDARVLCHNRVRQHRGPLKDRGQINGVPFRRIPFLDLKYYQPCLPPISMLRQADVIHIHAPKALLDFAALAKPLHRRPIVLSTHGGLFHTRALRRLKQVYFRAITRQSLRAVDQTIACSAGDYELFKPICPNLVLIENGVDLDRFNGIARPGQPAPGPPRVLYLGRFARHKQIDLLIRTFGLVHQAGGCFRLRLAGPDDERLIPGLRALAADCGIAGLTSFHDRLPSEQLPAEYAQADYFVSASEFEGFGISVIEAMASGCVPILNRIPPFVRLVQDERHGFLVDFSDSAGAARRIGDLLRLHANPQWLAIRQAARDKARQYAWPARIPQFIEIYRRLAGAAT